MLHQGLKCSTAVFALLLAASAWSSESCHLNDDGSERRAPDPGADPECVVDIDPVPSTEAREGEASRGIAGGSLTTTFVSDNSFAGNTFDLEPTTPITIEGFDVNLQDTTNGSQDSTIAVYWREGTADGAQSSAAGWTLLGTDTVSPAAANTPTFVDIGGLPLDAGGTYGFYIEVQSYPTASMLYTNGGPTTYSNADLSLTTFYGKGSPAFSGENFFPRQWNGTVYYSLRETTPVAEPVPGLDTYGLWVLLIVVLVSGSWLARRSL